MHAIFGSDAINKLLDADLIYPYHTILSLLPASEQILQQSSKILPDSWNRIISEQTNYLLTLFKKNGLLKSNSGTNKINGETSNETVPSTSSTTTTTTATTIRTPSSITIRSFLSYFYQLELHLRSNYIDVVLDIYYSHILQPCQKGINDVFTTILSQSSWWLSWYYYCLQVGQQYLIMPLWDYYYQLNNNNDHNYQQQQLYLFRAATGLRKHLGNNSVRINDAFNILSHWIRRTYIDITDTIQKKLLNTKQQAINITLRMANKVYASLTASITHNDGSSSSNSSSSNYYIEAVMEAARNEYVVLSVLCVLFLMTYLIRAARRRERIRRRQQQQQQQ